MLTHEQTYEENRKEFINRLIEAGWSKEEALKEWEAIQSEDKG